MSVTTRILAGTTASLMLFGGSVSVAHAAPIDVPPEAAQLDVPPQPAPTDAPLLPSAESEVEFVSDGITYYGSLRTPAGAPRGASLLLP
ncbi:MAG: hypothetical protein WBQ44_09895, partial [Rhodococcus sp. (in: high G+C Gram-positive bacteria)]